jgi:hypothetical protein
VSAAGEGCKAAIDAERWLATQGHPLTEDPGGENGDDPRRTPFGAILAYVFTFLAILALLAYLLVALLRR